MKQIASENNVETLDAFAIPGQGFIVAVVKKENRVVHYDIGVQPVHPLAMDDTYSVSGLHDIELHGSEFAKAPSIEFSYEKRRKNETMQPKLPLFKLQSREDRHLGPLLKVDMRRAGGPGEAMQVAMMINAIVMSLNQQISFHKRSSIGTLDTLIRQSFDALIT